MTGWRQRPVPEIPSSHVSQLDGQAVQLGPKNPLAQVSQEEPVNPGEQAHVPADVQVPELAQTGEHTLDSMSSMEMVPALFAGSWETSGTDSQKTTRLLEEPELAIIHTLEESASALADKGVDEFATRGEEGREMNVDSPEYSDSVNVASPG